MEKLDLRYKGQSLALPEGSVGLETTVTELRAAVAKVAGLDARTVRLLGLRKGRGKGAPGQARDDDDDVLVSDCLSGNSSGRVVVMGRVIESGAGGGGGAGPHQAGDQATASSLATGHYRPSSPPKRDAFNMFGAPSFSRSGPHSSNSANALSAPPPVRPAAAGVGLDGLLKVSTSLEAVIAAHGSLSDAIAEMKKSFRALLVVVLDDGASESEGGGVAEDADAAGDSEKSGAARSRWMLANGLIEGPAAEFIAQNFILWAARVPGEPETAAKVRQVLKAELKCESFPFMMLIGNIGTVSVLEVTQGEAATQGGSIQLLSRVFAMHDNSAPLLESAQAVATASMELQAVRDEQLDAFNKAQEEDKRRMSTMSSNSSGDGDNKMNENANQASDVNPGGDEDGDNDMNIDSDDNKNNNPGSDTVVTSPSIDTEAILSERRSAAESTLGPEPPAGSGSEIATVALRAPDGSRVIRRVKPETRIVDLQVLALSLCDATVDKVRLVTSFPRTVFEQGDDRSLKEAGLCPTTQLFIEPID